MNNKTTWVALLFLTLAIWLPTVELRLVSGLITAAAIQQLLKEDHEH